MCQSDLFEAVEVVLVGKEKKDRIMSEEERKIVSYHEVGHALVTALQKKYRAGTEDHDRSENDGRAGVCDADIRKKRSYLNTKKELER